ncbi:Ras family protein, partial [Ancylostoma duodenale]
PASFQIWDTAGQERFRSVTAAYYRDADALLLVFDVSNRASFENVRSWLAQIREYGKESVQITLVGNKCDLGSSRTVRSDEARHLAAVSALLCFQNDTSKKLKTKDVLAEFKKKQLVGMGPILFFPGKGPDKSHLFQSYCIPYIETSAKTGHNVNQAFLDIAR